MVKEITKASAAEIKAVKRPANDLKSTVLTTLLLLGHFEEETKSYRKVHAILQKTGKDAIHVRTARLKTEDVPLNVALGARHRMKDTSLECARKVSLAAEDFYRWNQEVTEEVLSRYSEEEISKTEPRTKLYTSPEHERQCVYGGKSNPTPFLPKSNRIREINKMDVNVVKTFNTPPAFVVTTVRSTLLLLGHFEEETQNYKRAQAVLKRTGMNAIHVRMGRLQVEDVPLNVALGAREWMKNFSPELLMCSSSAAVGFHRWNQEVTEEVLSRYSEEEISKTEPRTKFYTDPEPVQT